MSKYPLTAISVAGAAKRLAVGNAAQATASLPLTANGETATLIRLATPGNCGVLLGQATTVAASTSTSFLMCANEAVLMKCAGYSYIAALTDTTTYLIVQAVEIG